MTHLAVRHGVVVLAAALGGCFESSTDPSRDEDPAPEPPGSPGPPRVLVVNTLSETLTSLDLRTGILTVQAALLGTWANRVRATHDGDAFLVTASGENEVQVISAHSLELLFGIDVGPGANPWLAIPISSKEALVTNWLSGDVKRLDLEARSALDPLTTTPGPEGVASDGVRAWIACTNYDAGEDSFGEGRLDVIDLSAWRRIASIPVGANPQDVLVAGDGRVHVLCTGAYDPAGASEGSVHVVDPASLDVASVIELGDSPGRFTLDGKGCVWVAGFSGGIKRYDSASLERLPDPSDEALRLPGISGIDADDPTGLVYMTNFEADVLVAFDRETASVETVWLVGDGPVDVLVARGEETAGR
jgi:DNA-binding beta-propeller fold protein YncE